LEEEIAVGIKSEGEPLKNKDMRGHLLIPPRERGFILIDTQKPICDPLRYP
jgi:hypothetical protein